MKKIKAPLFTLKKDYEYIPRIKWTNDPNKLVIYGLNRHQNELDFIVANVANASNKVLFTEIESILY